MYSRCERAFSYSRQFEKTSAGERTKAFRSTSWYEKHLVIYTRKEWDKISAEVNSLNMYVKKNREFLRKFNNGASPIELDGTNRLLLPKTLMDYAGVEKDIVLFAYGNRIEIWSEAEYVRMMKDESENFSDLAEEVMGKKKKGVADDDLS